MHIMYIMNTMHAMYTTYTMYTMHIMYIMDIMYIMYRQGFVIWSLSDDLLSNYETKRQASLSMRQRRDCRKYEHGKPKHKELYSKNLTCAGDGMRLNMA